MKKWDYQNVRGTQDYLPEDESVRVWLRRVLEEVFQQYGCKPMETPMINYADLLASKYGGGAEIKKEMYTLTDRGKRALALRYDLTIPFAKVMAMNPEIRKPFKRYEIGKVFRDGPIKAGRFREFTQCDVDVAGVDSPLAEAELLEMATEVFRRIGLNIHIQYNNRKLLTGVLDLCGVRNDQHSAVILVLDKREKIGDKQALTELKEIGVDGKAISKIEQWLKQTSQSRSVDFANNRPTTPIMAEGIAELQELEEALLYLNIDNQCTFNPFLARGLEMYTGTVYELFLTEGPIQSSVGSGGRYDQAISGLIGEEQPMPTVGISFGIDVIYTALKMEGRINQKRLLDYYVIPLQKQKEALAVASSLRKQGFRVDVEFKNKKLTKALERANKERVPFVIIIGEEEVASGRYKLKNMETGAEQDVPFSF
ncbi:histidine--tRNA ligase 1 [Shouchella clausii]|nr:histidine--tRNA ligase 1 [Shouchella clausii]